jgi:hypothetical protein
MVVKDQVAQAKERLIKDAGKAMVKGMVDDLTLSPEERAAKDAADEGERRSRMIKIILAITGAIVAGIVVMKVLAAVWMYGIALVVLLGLGGVGYLAARPKIEAFKTQRLEKKAAAELERTAASRRAAELQAKADAEAAVAAAKKKLEDDLARLKSQV